MTMMNLITAQPRKILPGESTRLNPIQRTRRSSEKYLNIQITKIFYGFSLSWKMKRDIFDIRMLGSFVVKAQHLLLMKNTGPNKKPSKNC